MELSFPGRFHPLLVHLPIGILWMAFLFELLSRFKGYGKIKSAVRPALFLGACSAVISAFTGYWLSQEGGYDERLLRVHQYLGIGTAIFALIIYLHRKYSFISDKPKRRMVRLALFLILMVFLTATGHFGGSLTHGEGYLFGSDGVTAIDAAIAYPIISDVPQAKVFDDVIKPIFEQKCYGCHSVKKQKGQLRLDSQEFIEKGGKHGHVVAIGNPNESELFKRITLSIEAEHHMPPEERKQLTSLETNVVRAWIEEGASFNQRVLELKNPSVIEEFISAHNLSASNSDLLSEGVPAPDGEVVEKLRRSGVLVLPLATHSNYLRVSFMEKQNISSEDATLISTISKQIIELDLSGCALSPAFIKVVNHLPGLRSLFLQRSSVTDSDLKAMVSLKKLVALNLTTTKISDTGLLFFEGLPELKHLYLYQTSVTKKGVEELQRRLPQAEIDTGDYQLPILAADTIIHKRVK